MKIGITIPYDTSLKNGNIYSNGIRLNVLLWYEFFKNCGYEVHYLSNNNLEDNTPVINFKEIWDKEKLVENYQKHQLFNLDCVFVIGLSHFPLLEICKKHNIKIIYVMLGSIYHNDAHTLYDKNFNSGYITDLYDEIWISPHFKFCKEYYKIRYKTEKVFLCPYFWREDLLKLRDTFDNVKTDVKENLRIGIVEPNVEQAKNCLIPIAICEKAEKYIKFAMIFNTTNCKSGIFFKNFILQTDIYKNKKLTVENRYALSDILKNYCNCIVSCTRDCDLNYVALECFYLGVPYVHNSPLLKDYGYYYPEYNVSKGAEQIEFLVKNHDREKYIQKHKPLLEKFSVKNPMFISWARNKIKERISYDCEFVI